MTNVITAYKVANNMVVNLSDNSIGGQTIKHLSDMPQVGTFNSNEPKCQWKSVIFMQ